LAVVVRFIDAPETSAWIYSISIDMLHRNLVTLDLDGQLLGCAAGGLPWLAEV
jgi:hypothetical protein